MLRYGEYGIRNPGNHYEEVGNINIAKGKVASGKYKDDLIGQISTRSFIDEARRVELKYPKGKRVMVIKGPRRMLQKN